MLKVFMVDDMTWVAAESEQEAIDYCINEMGHDIDEVYTEECDVNKPDAMWWNIEPEEVPLNLAGMYNMQDNTNVINGVTYGTWDGSPAKMISYTEAHKLYNEKMPYIIASCL